MCQYDTSSPFRKILYTAPKFLFIVTFVIVCVLYANVRNQDSTFQGPETRILTRIFTNVNQNPINGIQLADAATGACPDGTTKVDLGSWRGTTAGCLCPNSEIINSACTEDNVGCEDIPAVSAQPFSKWNNNVFCIQRLPTTSIKECATTDTPCGAGMCVVAGAACPFTDLKVTTTVTTFPASYSSLALNTTHSLFYSSGVVDEPIVDIIISLYDEPCMDPDSQPFSKDKVPYPLSVIPENGCSTGGAIDHLLNIEVMGVPTLFDENNITPKIQVISNYPVYISDEFAYLVGLRQYTTRTTVKQCTALNPRLFNELYDYEDTFKSSVIGILIAAVSLSCIVFVTIFIEVILRVKSDEEHTRSLKFFAFANLFLLFITGLLYIISGSFGIRAKVDLDPDLKDLKLISKSQCFQQEVVNRILQVYYEDTWDFYVLVWLNIILLILASAGIILALILVIIDNISSRKGGASYYKGIGDGPKRNKTGGGKTVGNIELLLKD